MFLVNHQSPLLAYGHNYYGHSNLLTELSIGFELFMQSLGFESLSLKNNVSTSRFGSFRLELSPEDEMIWLMQFGRLKQNDIAIFIVNYDYYPRLLTGIGTYHFPYSKLLCDYGIDDEKELEQLTELYRL